MEVLKTISPQFSPAAPQERPRHTRPSSKANKAAACCSFAMRLALLEESEGAV
jgi:hypothetical protein